MRSKIYTKTGDRGRTGTFLGRMGKDDLLAQALGTVDELNSWIGMCRNATPMDEELKRMQKNLLTIGSGLAGSGMKISAAETKLLERVIDRLTKKLPRLTNFVYPTGPLHVARTVARRAEREIVAAGVSDKSVLKYMNRLSDALFTMARWVNFKQGGVEEVWRG